MIRFNDEVFREMAVANKLVSDNKTNCCSLPLLFYFILCATDIIKKCYNVLKI
jgi:hypothetical protein